MTAEIVCFPDPHRHTRHADAVHRDHADSAVIIILPIVRIESYAEPRRRKRFVSPPGYDTPFG